MTVKPLMVSTHGPDLGSHHTESHAAGLLGCRLQTSDIRGDPARDVFIPHNVISPSFHCFHFVYLRFKFTSPVTFYGAGIKSSTSHMLGKCSTPELDPRHRLLFKAAF